MPPIISIKDLSKTYGTGLSALKEINLDIDRGEIFALLGPNGAGKTTLFNVIAGLYQPTAGRVYLDGEDITGLKPHELFARGLLRTFQIAHEFASLSVRDNLMMVPAGQPGERLLQTWLKPGSLQKNSCVRL